ncbi:ATP-binding cassette domain-containing protein [Methanobrevibacter sp. OttesenSCG-928-K11]|nr:ATP-binding cassette domain-containing protein [Methanobrevibacter sp. OttesenSCG-928-K11]MDL2270762.1 ATP-binding cassette domain-containing protein [Methanobrevibacter sp. OttesenSCG-928-I08]
MLKVKNITYSYDNKHDALKNISLEIKKGEMVSLLGENGAGKSTLFLHFNGILEPDEGEIFIDSEKLKYDKKSLIQVRQKVGIVFQNPDDQLFAPTVEEDVAFGPLNIGLSQEETQERVADSLKKVGMEGYEKKPPHHLSGGQKKRVAIAGILAMQPEIMVLDEPTSGLDPKGASDILKLLYKLNKEGITILISTHDVDAVPLYSDRIFVINKGEIIKDGSPEEVFKDIELIRSSNLRLPRITHLFEVLDKEDDINNVGDYPLTISQARKFIKDNF